MSEEGQPTVVRPSWDPSESSDELYEREIRANHDGGPFIEMGALAEWRTAIRQWIDADVPIAGSGEHVVRSVAAWADGLRLAGRERRWLGPDIRQIRADVHVLALQVVPEVLRRVGPRSLEALALSLLRLVDELQDRRERLAESTTLVRGALALVIERRPTVVGHLAYEVQHRSAITMPASRSLLSDLGVVDSAMNPIGLPIDGSDLDLASLLWGDEVRRTVRRTIEQAIPAVTDSFLIELLVDDEPVSYVQGIIEDDGFLHVELAHESVVERPLPDERRTVLFADGWSEPDPEEGLPNYWRLLDLAKTSHSAIADLLVRSMHVAHRAFDGLPVDVVISVKPLDVAICAIPTDAVIVDADWGTEGSCQGGTTDRSSGSLVPSTVLIGLVSAVDRAIEWGPVRSLDRLHEASALLLSCTMARLALRRRAGARPNAAETAAMEVATRALTVKWATGSLRGKRIQRERRTSTG